MAKINIIAPFEYIGDFQELVDPVGVVKGSID
jgi:hypothetical protein